VALKQSPLRPAASRFAYPFTQHYHAFLLCVCVLIVVVLAANGGATDHAHRCPLLSRAGYVWRLCVCAPTVSNPGFKPLLPIIHAPVSLLCILCCVAVNCCNASRSGACMEQPPGSPLGPRRGALATAARPFRIQITVQITHALTRCDSLVSDRALHHLYTNGQQRLWTSNDNLDHIPPFLLLHLGPCQPASPVCP